MKHLGRSWCAIEDGVDLQRARSRTSVKSESLFRRLLREHPFWKTSRIPSHSFPFTFQALPAPSLCTSTALPSHFHNSSAFLACSSFVQENEHFYGGEDVTERLSVTLSFYNCTSTYLSRSSQPSALVRGTSYFAALSIFQRVALDARSQPYFRAFRLAVLVALSLYAARRTYAVAGTDTVV